MNSNEHCKHRYIEINMDTQKAECADCGEVVPRVNVIIKGTIGNNLDNVSFQTREETMNSNEQMRREFEKWYGALDNPDDSCRRILGVECFSWIAFQIGYRAAYTAAAEKYKGVVEALHSLAERIDSYSFDINNGIVGDFAKELKALAELERE